MNHKIPHSVEVALAPGDVAEIIERMSQSGCDLSAVLAATDKVKTGEQALRDAARKAALKAATRRFVISYVYEGCIRIAQGIQYEEGNVHVERGHPGALSGPDSSMRHLCEVIKRHGFTYHIEYID